MGDHDQGQSRDHPIDEGVPVFTCDEELHVTSLTDSGRLLFDGSVVGESLETLEQDGVLGGRTVERLREVLSKNPTDDGEAITTTLTQRSAVRFEMALYRDGPGADIDVVLSEQGLLDRTQLLAELRRASERFQSAETAPELMQQLERCLATLLQPTGIDVRLHEPATAQLWRVSQGEATAVVDARESVDSTTDPYASVIERGESVRLTGERLTTLADAIDDATSLPSAIEGFSEVIVVPVGDHGTVSVGRLGTTLSEGDEDAIQLLCEYAATAIQRRQEGARVSEQRTELDRYETLVESISDPVYLTDETGEIAIVNRAFERTFGYDPDEHRNVHITEFTTTESATRLREAIRDLVDAKRPDISTDLSVTGVLPDGRHHEFQATVGCVAHDGQFDSAVGVLRDVTDRHRQQEISKVMNRAFRHNLRTATNNIKGYAEVTQAKVSGDAHSHMDIIQEECDWLVKLGDTMREIQKSISGGETETEIPVAELVEPVKQWNENEYPEATVTVHYNTDGHIEGGTTLQTALDNIVENAIVHSESQRATVEIWVANAPEENCVDIHVKDTGPGIPKQERQLIMGETEITQLQHGSGLGLWVARWLVQTFDGKLLIESDADGSVVTLRLRKVQ